MDFTSPGLHKKNMLATDLKAYWAVRENIGQTILYSTILLLLSAAIYCWFTTGFALQLSTHNFNIICAVVYFILGLVHLFVFPLLLWHIPPGGFKNGFGYTLLMTLLLAVVLLFLQQGNQTKNYHFVLIAACAFLVPYAMLQCKLSFTAIAAREYATWILPDVLPTGKSLFHDGGEIYFEINIKVKFIDADETLFAVNAAGDELLGMAFSFFISQHSSIKIKNPNGEPYGWRFFKKGVMGVSLLDPTLDLKANNIKQQDIVWIERIRL